MARVNTTRYALLGMLALGPSSGYDIKRKMAQSTDHFWSESDGSIYPILKQLLEQNRVSVHQENLNTAKPKNIYTITPAGRQELESWLAQAPSVMLRRNELLLKLFFGANVDKAIIINHLYAFKSKCQQLLMGYEAHELSYMEKKLSQDVACQWATLKCGIAHTQTNIRWCDETIGMLKNAI